jgi:ribosomal 50S subunit-associated protein YjgA (DUF615 family)
VPRKRFIDTAEPEPDVIPSRTDAKKERVRAEEELMSLSTALVGMNARMLGRLPLSETALEAIREAAAIQAPAARYRALRVVRAALRDMDLAALRKALDRLHGR